jgi:hypothetical protein
MMRKPAVRPALCLAVLTALIVFAGMQVAQVSAQTRNMPVFELDRAWPKVPPQWRLGDPSSIGIDAQDNIWVLQRPRTLKPEQAKMTAPAIVVFDGAGNFIKAWGGDGTGFEWPQREHGIHIDHKGFVWLGGNNCPTNGIKNLKPVADDQLLKFTQDGKFVMQIGKSNQSKGNNDTTNLHRPADVWVHEPTNELFVADGYGNHRVAVYDADKGNFKRMWGAFGNKPLDDDNCEVITPKTFSDPGPQQLSIVHAMRVAKDGTVYIADREYRRVQMFTKEGKFVRQVVRVNEPFARNLALSHDPDQQFLYVGGGKGVYILDRKTLEVVGSVTPPGVIGPGHQIATDSKGNLYIAATGQGMQKLIFKGMSGPATN